MSNRLYVGNLAFHTTEDTLRETFAAFGEVGRVDVPTDRMTGRPRGFASVTMVDVEAAKRASTVGVFVADVWYVRHLSELMQSRGLRVVLLTDSASAIDVIVAARCDVLVAERNVRGAFADDLCGALRAKLGARRPWFVVLA